jgi:hypothetical protein
MIKINDILFLHFRQVNFEPKRRLDLPGVSRTKVFMLHPGMPRYLPSRFPDLNSMESNFQPKTNSKHGQCKHRNYALLI